MTADARAVLPAHSRLHQYRAPGRLVGRQRNGTAVHHCTTDEKHVTRARQNHVHNSDQGGRKKNNGKNSTLG